MSRQNNPSLILTHTLKSDKTQRPLRDEEIIALTVRAVESIFWLRKFLIYSALNPLNTQMLLIENLCRNTQIDLTGMTSV